MALQSPAASHSADHRITLDVVVKDKAGNLISGLHQQDFAVLNDKKPQEIASFRAVSGATPNDPVKIILLVDEVNASFQSVAFGRDAIEKFLRQNGGQLSHPVSMIFFSDTDTQVLNGASRDGNALIAAFEQHVTKLRTLRRSAGFYGAVDRFQLSITNLNSIAVREQAEPGRKILIWISPGWPYLSGPHVNLSSNEQRRLFGSIVALNTSLRRAQIALYSIDPLGTADAGGFRTFYYESFLKGVALPKDAEAGNLSLQVIATQSGGRVLNSNNDVAALISSAAAEANSYYVLTIDSPPAEHPDEYHAIQVKIEQPGLIAQTRTGYYANPSSLAQ
ncbi:VWA domain-containing protein [Granulicella arctica]|uniref:VWFA-related protein n=1 Tax=Granulicella arctica TaxID=940613 RepID=A0A7Y9PE91_9BACT|nr:VWFA-related protein [Granulicella arctica]